MKSFWERFASELMFAMDMHGNAYPDEMYARHRARMRRLHTAYPRRWRRR